MNDNRQADDSILIRPAAAAKLLAVSKPYVYKMVKLGVLPSVEWTLDGSKSLRILRQDVLDFIEQHRS